MEPVTTIFGSSDRSCMDVPAEFLGMMWCNVKAECKV